MAISLSRATQALLDGKTLTWEKFAQHKSGSITLSSPGQRRLFEFLLAQDAAGVAQGSEDLFAGLIAAWKNESADPASRELEKPVETEDHVWRLDRIESLGFGGLTLFGSKPFDFWVNGENWCLEGQNGSGKTSLASAILWALTGKRIREQDGLIDEHGTRPPVTNSEGRKEEDAYAEGTGRYSDLQSAVDCTLSDCGFKLPADMQGSLFQEV